MIEKWASLRLLASLLAAALLAGLSGADEAKKDAKKEEKGKKGTVVGMLTAKGDNWLEVKADGEVKARRYVPHWRGGAPKDGGGPDKKTLATIRKLKVGSRLRLEWTFEERARIEKVEVLKEAAEKKDGEKGKEK
jgi:hypothetical protein